MKEPDEHTACLRAGEMPTPQLFHSGKKIGIVENGKVVLGSQSFRPEGHVPPDGTEVIIRLLNGPGAVRIAFESKAEREAYDAWLNAEWERRRREEQAERERRIEEASIERERIVADLNERVPFRWTTGIRVVLSGVLEHSHLTGTNRRSVNHIATLEDIECGRLRRKAQEFLCSTDPGRMWGHVDDEERKGCPTCPKCMEIVERLIMNPKLVVHRKDEDEPAGPAP